jgi:hypothetical protein
MYEPFEAGCATLLTLTPSHVDVSGTHHQTTIAVALGECRRSDRPHPSHNPPADRAMAQIVFDQSSRRPTRTRHWRLSLIAPPCR